MPAHPKCWAALLGDCHGSVTREHIVSDAVIPEGKRVAIHGFPWCEESIRMVSVKAFAAKCLCEQHNNRLSECDTEALRFREAIEWSQMPVPSPPDRGVRYIDGVRFGRWLAKTACNNLAVCKKHVPAPLVRYSFVEQRHQAVTEVYMPVKVGLELDVNCPEVRFAWRYAVDNPDELVMVVTFFGLHFIIATTPVVGREQDIGAMIGSPLESGSLHHCREPFAIRFAPNRAVYITWPENH